MTTHLTAVDIQIRSNAGRGRRFAPADIPAVTALHRRSFETDGSESEYRRFFSEVFLDHVSVAPEISSLVFEDSEGAISGFQGVQPRRMFFNGKALIAAIFSHSAVDPDRRGVAGVRLRRKSLKGPQDL